MSSPSSNSLSGSITPRTATSPVHTNSVLQPETHTNLNGYTLGDDLPSTATAEPANGTAAAPTHNQPIARVGKSMTPARRALLTSTVIGRLSRYGAIDDAIEPLEEQQDQTMKWHLVRAGLEVLLLFILCALVLGGTLFLALPRISPDDQHLFKFPRSFDDLQGLNILLKKLKAEHNARIFVCWIATYLFVQAFCIPGSMYLSILAGALWGLAITAPLICFCVACGSLLCYALSAAFGPALLALPTWRQRIESFAAKVQAQRENLVSYLIILRISPLPHWLINLIAPHVRIRVGTFFVSTFIGSVPLAIIHATIGGGLEQMTSPDDFHLLSWKNLGLMLVVVAAALVPVLVRKLSPAAQEAAVAAAAPAEVAAATERTALVKPSASLLNGTDTAETLARA
ncbi:snare associated Golgi protein-domain-containing protein [Auriculariales sp. MPI-PUGE-AT-0066]|nr:snare associated Golgi protein-domain-containing protein [Auriculariales sp. MPI-PUGE-AT-0066]